MNRRRNLSVLSVLLAALACGSIMPSQKADAQSVGKDRYYAIYALVLNRGTWQWEHHYEPYLTSSEAAARKDYWIHQRAVRVYTDKILDEYISPE